MTRALLVGAITVLSLAGLALPASAASKGGATPTGTVTPASCPASGQRVKASNSSAIYLIDPQGYWDHIENSTVYFQLWDTWDGITVVSPSVVSSCMKYGGEFAGFLVQVTGDPAVYIYDNTYDAFRWITSGTVFNAKYHFAPDKIIQALAISPIGLPWS